MTATHEHPRAASLRARVAELEQRVGNLEGRQIVGGADALAELLDRVAALESRRDPIVGQWAYVKRAELDELVKIRDLARDAFGPDPVKRVYSVVEIRRLVDA